MARTTRPGDPPVAPEGEPIHWLVRPATVRGIWIGFIAVLVAIVLADFVVHHYEYFGVDGTFGFYAWYGFLTCVAMVVGAKVLGFVLKRPDDYYREPDAGVERGGRAS